MLTLIRPTGASKRGPRVRRCAFTDLAPAPRLRLVGHEHAAPRRATPEQREVLAIAVDRMIDEALAQLNAERRAARARIVKPAAALAP